jgi:hypothetical protein
MQGSPGRARVCIASAGPCKRAGRRRGGGGSGESPWGVGGAAQWAGLRLEAFAGMGSDQSEAPHPAPCAPGTPDPPPRPPPAPPIAPPAAPRGALRRGDGSLSVAGGAGGNGAPARTRRRGAARRGRRASLRARPPPAAARGEMSFRWALGGGPGDGDDDCARHGPGAGCNCFAGGAAVQSLDEVAFARSACQAAAAGAVARLARILDRAPDAVHSDGGKGAAAAAVAGEGPAGARWPAGSSEAGGLPAPRPCRSLRPSARRPLPRPAPPHPTPSACQAHRATRRCTTPRARARPSARRCCSRAARRSTRAPSRGARRRCTARRTSARCP